jgi:1-acyl-sn-glycerol-3-phosphate acyltransferase
MGRVRRPDSISNAGISILATAFLPVGIALLSALAIVMALAGASSRAVHFCYRAFARICIWTVGTRVEVHGLEHVDPEQGYVVVSNHESNWDPVCLVGGLPDLILRFVVKRQLMQIPIFGRALRITGNIEVVRRREASDVRRIKETMQRRDAYVSMLFFAEGTRARDGSFREFKLGAFATALDEHLPILPVAVAGSYAIWPPETFWFRRAPAVVEVGEPILTDTLGYPDRAALRDQTREAVGKLRSRARERLRAQGFEPGGID